MLAWRSAHRELSCRVVGRLVQAYLDGEIADDRVVAIADHLDRCVRCGRDADGYRWLKLRLGTLAPPLAPDELARLRSFADSLS